MSVLVFVEQSNGEIKKSSREAVSYAAAMNSGDVVALVMGSSDESQLKSLGANGASKVLHVADNRLDKGVIRAYASVIAQVMNNEDSETLILADSSLGNPVAARVSIKTTSPLASNVVDLPDTSSGFKVRRSIYTGKAFANTSLEGSKRILILKKGAAPLKEDGAEASVESVDLSLDDNDFGVTITSQEKATGQVLLPEADIVVSGGRGLKGPENWGMIEELAAELGAATACSKPVSDMDWRPHHEHVGQTGIKVAPTLYIAVGISGAIQHLAGVNSSKFIVVINKDADAPFFKAADYGIIGDAFEVVPKLTEAIKAAK